MAPRSLRQTLNSGLGLPPNAYIYKIISTSPRQDPLSYSKVDQLAVIASDDSLRFLDPATLNTLPDGVVKNVNDKVTCLERCNDPTSNIVATAGRDGLIIFRDKRSRQKVASIESPNKLISSLVCDNQRNFIATGIENPNDGPGVSPVYVWDQRHTQKPILEFVESHTDTVTDLQLHPSLPALLLSASTDGLVNIFDVSKPDEEEALYQVINHRSAVARAGFIYPSTDIYAMGTDETLSFYALQSQEEEKTEPPPKAYGDMREHLGSEYLAKLHWIGSEPYVAAGKHRANELALFPISKDTQSPLEYAFVPDRKLFFAGAHGEEIVRDLFSDVHTNITYTCGEDGYVRAWLMEGNEKMDIDDATEVKRKKKEKKEKRKEKKEKRKGEDEGKKGRYAPY